MNKEITQQEPTNPKLRVAEVSNSPDSFGIHNNTEIGLSIPNRIRVLFGKSILVSIDITLDKEVSILDTESKVFVSPFLKRKPSKTDFAQSST